MERIGIFNILFLIFVTFIGIKSSDATVVSMCKDQCTSSLTTIVDRDLLCNSTCRINACGRGCELYDNTTTTNCNNQCSKEFIGTKVQYCGDGCEFGLNEYADAVFDAAGVLEAPIPMGYTDSTVSLSWIGSTESQVTYQVQWRYTQLQETRWQTFNLQPISATDVEVTGLYPFTSYAFRVRWIVITIQNSQVTPESQVVTTNSNGLPLDAPVITSLVSGSPTTISVSWQEVAFPAGPLQSYSLEARSTGQTLRIDIGSNVLFHTFTSLLESTSYTISVAAVNVEGVGPKSSQSITTQDPPADSGVTPYIIIGATHVDTNDEQIVSSVDIVPFDMDVKVTRLHAVEANVSIVDVAVYYNLSSLYITDSEGTIWQKDILVDEFGATVNETAEELYTNSNTRPTRLDVDWLNDFIYFVQDTSIMRCSLACMTQEAVIGNIGSVPTELKVDPVNGYLYWSEMDDGIYRLDLADVGGGALSKRELIVSLSGIRSFTVDSTALDLIYPNQSSSAFMVAFIDGTEKKSLRSENELFQNVTSVIFQNNLLRWSRTTPKTFCYQSFSTSGNLYYEKVTDTFEEYGSYFCPNGYHGLEIFHPSTQPIPIPYVAPSGLQVLFTESSADISWDTLIEIEEKGAGAWRSWLYEVEVITVSDGATSSLDGIPETAALAEKLDSDTEYRIRVRAYSDAGNGPWSVDVTGRTFQAADPDAYILIVTDKGLQKMDLDGNNNITLYSGVTSVLDLAWYQDQALWISNDGATLSTASLTDNSNNPTELTGADSLSFRAVAVDWIGEVLYWSDSTQRQIYRGGLDLALSQIQDPQEIILQFADARDIALDPLNAYIYWSEEKSVNYAHLNGEDKKTFYSLGEFSQDQVVGLTLDLGGNQVFWLVLMSSDGSRVMKLFSSTLAPISLEATEVAVVDSSTEISTMHLYSRKLFWLNDASQLVVGDNTGQAISIIPSADANEVSIIQDSLQPYPAGFSRGNPPNVKPDTILESQITIDGEWGAFNVTWPAGDEVQFGTVWYELALVAGGMPVSTVQTENFYTITSFDPYTEFDVTVLPYTYWYSSQAVTSTLTSPESVPTVPLEERLFVTEDVDVTKGVSSFTMQFRWSQVAKANGVLQGYEVFYGEEQNNLQSVTVSSQTFEFMQTGITGDVTMYFKVRGYTSIGPGPETTVLSGTTTAINPPPTVLSFGDSTGITVQDLDSSSTNTIATTVIPVALTYNADRNIFYYADQSRVFSQEGEAVKRLADTQIAILATAFTFDWVAQRLYWAEGPGVYEYDLISSSSNAKMLFSANENVGGLTVSPFDRLLLWTEDQGDGTQSLRVRDLTTSSRKKRQTAGCDCPLQVATAPISATIALDSTDTSNSQVYYINATTNDLWVSDTAQCNCSLLFENSSVSESGLPPSFLSVDADRVYWSNTDVGIVASVLKADGSDFQSQMSDANIVLAYNQNLQPYPAPECLKPAGPVSSPALAEENTFKDRLILNLVPVSPPSQCSSVTFATPLYTIRYGETDSGGKDCTNGLNCTTMDETSELSVAITGLNAYTNYSIDVSAQNYYSMGLAVTSPVQLYQTWVGLPTKPLNVTPTALTPSEFEVTWIDPANPSGPLSGLIYTVQAVKSQKTEYPESIAGNTALFTSLDEATEYQVQVFVKQQDAREDDTSPSDVMSVITFSAPDQVTEVSKTSVSLTVSWTSPGDGSIQYHRLEHFYAGSDVWSVEPDADWTILLDEATVSGMEYRYTIDGLLQYSKYQMRIQVQYQSGRWYQEQNNREIQEFMTEGDVPEAINTVNVMSDTNNGIYDVMWDAPNARGPGVLQYTLQAKLSSSSANARKKRAFENWETVYEGRNTEWRVDLTQDQAYNFRVAASNDMGMGSYSPESEQLMVLPPPSSNTTIIIVIVVILVVVIVAVVMLFILVVRKKRPGKDNNFKPDQELATLRDYPNTVSGENNRMYALTKTADGKEVQLPTFPREKLKLAAFLGSGAFGEVYQGVALNILSANSGQTKVAVKTLKEGATDQEKDEFLKEAILMNNFHHGNIISLLGVCLNNDPNFIILELMAGGDLLSYLRGARGTGEAVPKLRDVDLIDIIVDIARGCKYLEELHFVHRDLAARNCLVSCKGYEDPMMRIVKIGDFGLARDLYKHDYYRKEGEGLLPVRWMAPEALIDGLFTNLSDIWAFGVLVWEVMTFGQQPYPARTNIEVLHFVTDGGRLDRPEECPDDIYDLMTKCWERMHKDRPSFLSILDRVEAYRRKSYGAGYANDGFIDDEKVKYSKLQNTPGNDDYLEPMDTKELIRRSVPAPLDPPDINLPPEKVPTPREPKREGSFRGPSSPRPILDAALESESWEKNKQALGDRYFQLPVGRSASSANANIKPGSKDGVSRGGSVNIPTRKSGAMRHDSDSKKRQAPVPPQFLTPDMGGPLGEAPKPPSPGGQPRPQMSPLRSPSQGRTDRDPPPYRTGSQSRQAPPYSQSNQSANNSQPSQNGGAAAIIRHPNPFRQFVEDGEDGDTTNVEIYNV